MAKLIETDPALTAKVLKLANSAFYSFSRKVTTVQRAVVVIGFQELQILTVGAGLAEVFDLGKCPPSLDGRQLWIHCLAVSWIGRELALASGYSPIGEIMIAGLLHDLGKLVLAAHLRDDFESIDALLKNGAPYYQAEAQTGLKHTTLGYWLAKRWGLPDIHAAAIRDHHAPQPEDPYLASTCLIYLADGLAKRLELGLVHESRPYSMSAAMKATNLTKEQLISVGKKVRDSMPEVLENWVGLLERGTAL